MCQPVPFFPIENSLSIAPRAERAGEPFPKAAIGCNTLQFSIVEWMERRRLSPYNRHVGQNTPAAAIWATKPLQPFQFSFPLPLEGVPATLDLELRTASGVKRSLGEKLQRPWRG